MRYKDIKTGAIIVTDSVLSGDWVADDGMPENTKTEPSEIEKEPDVAEEVVEEDEKLDELTVQELKARLDEMGVTYPNSARKQDLIDILSQF
ncbi:HeH/LEM domain-containing protein [Enterococcus cecorum]|uniref:HeH/LEM domain-containing protein n=1 Tax=Enterococcus cecorum TaxID=44008 RepID=UPI002ACA780A|nr:HeH/LEM domain-containing protein [Enterococcus cecorum]MDZ5548249.1 HeH/LEM domain-containing protein [Enterococcus cecorum]MDZ5594145.1 HeH/LEM domain-containing protein [Enterococcus cecorum]